MLEDFLSKLGASTRITVGVAVSPGLGLEMIEVDRATGTVNKYAHKPLDYNNSTREITDYEQFRVALEELFEELHIPKRSNIVLSVPNVHFGMITLPVLLTDEAITNAIISEVEQSYIFKRQEPVVSWSEVFSNDSSENRTLAYTAIQKDSFEQIIGICAEVGCTLAGLENSFSSLFRALSYINVTKEQMKENASWNLMIIMQNNYSIISMNGKKIVDYYEEPLALKSFVDDEIYNAIKTSAQLTLAGLPANYLFIVSETDLVSAEVLSMKMSFEGSVSFLECNKFMQNELLPINLNILPKLALQITPEAIGVAVYTFCDFPLKLNIVKDQENVGLGGDGEECPRINVGNLEVELTPDFIKKLTIIIGAIVVAPILLLFIMLNNIILPKEHARLDGISQQISVLNSEIDKYKESSQNNAFNINSVISGILNQNKTKLAYYSAVGVSIPEKLWITKLQVSGQGKVDIQGQARDVKHIYTFYKSIKQLVNNSDVRLYKLEMASGSIDNVISDLPTSSNTYNFEITNMSEAELNPAPTNQPNQSNQPDQSNQQNSNQPKSLFGFGNSLFGTNNQQPGNTQTPATNTQGQGVPPVTSPSTGNPQLPPNLQKIEKF